MKTKKFWQSKTINSGIIIIILALMSIMGVGEEKLGNTYDTLIDKTGQKTEAGKDVLTGILGALAIYGRKTAKTKIGGKDE